MANNYAVLARALRNTRDFDDNLETQRLYESACRQAEIEERMAEECPQCKKWLIDYKAKIGRWGRYGYYEKWYEYCDTEWATTARDAVKYFHPDIDGLVDIKINFVYEGDGGAPLPESEWK